MDLKSMCNDVVTIQNQDGRQHTNVKAQVSKNLIIIPNERIPVSIGDTILRPLPSGLVERLVVTEPGYHQSFHGIPGHYQAKYRHEANAPKPSAGTMLHVSGSNSRININSTDNSTNTVVLQIENSRELATELEKLRNALVQNASSSEHYVAIGAIAEAEAAAKENDSSKLGTALNRLGACGQWVWETAQKIAIPVASKALAAHLGLSAS